ncbi:uncharacterized protein LOC135473799 [Liolophura sinensis]|uniref:uncharacterized protein LOC135473799 n=1 Tax=Liolophura sinensis TaxID=3198878 RepID=UPI003158B20C
MLEHLRWGHCSPADFSKVDTYIKSSPSSLVKNFWLVWGHEQLALKIFPVAKVAREPRCFQLSNHNSTAVLSDSRVSVAHVSIKEGLKNIIDSLKQQEPHGQTGMNEGDEKCAQCSCCAYVHSTSSPSATSPSQNKSERGNSAFHRPRATRKVRQSTTPYSDALKAVAVSPYRQESCKKFIAYEQKESVFGSMNRGNSVLDRRSCYPQKMPHLHSLYCDFFGTKVNTASSSAEPSSTTSL